MFEGLEPVSQRPKHETEERFREDPNPKKINLHTGLYKNPEGRSFILPCVKRAEERILQEETDKVYLDMAGSPGFIDAVQKLIFDEDHECLKTRRVATVQTPGGTAALRVAADFLARNFPDLKVWVPEQTWANHLNVFEAAGLEIARYPWMDDSTRDLAFDRMIGVLKQVPENDAVLFHASCHNPTGTDPTPLRWLKIAEVAEQQKFLPIFDVAFPGLGRGIRDDLEGVMKFCGEGRETIIALSLSKVFSLYNERVGALLLVASGEKEAGLSLGHLRACIRANYSNPPAHGAAIVATVLNDPELCREWKAEVESMRFRIRKMREEFVRLMSERNVSRDFQHVLRETGIFTRIGLSSDQVRRLREEHSIYMAEDAHFNLVALTEEQLPHLCDALASLIRAEAVTPPAPSKEIHPAIPDDVPVPSAADAAKPLETMPSSLEEGSGEPLGDVVGGSLDAAPEAVAEPQDAPEEVAEFGAEETSPTVEPEPAVEAALPAPETAADAEPPEEVEFEPLEEPEDAPEKPLMKVKPETKMVTFSEEELAALPSIEEAEKPAGNPLELPAGVDPDILDDIRRVDQCREIFAATKQVIETWEVFCLVFIEREETKKDLDNILSLKRQKDEMGFIDAALALFQRLLKQRAEHGRFVRDVRTYVGNLPIGHFSPDTMEMALGFIVVSPRGREYAQQWLAEPKKFEIQAAGRLEELINNVMKYELALRELKASSAGS